MIAMLVGLAFGMDGVLVRQGTLVEQPATEASYAEIDAAMAPFAARLTEVLATEGWFAVDGATLLDLDATAVAHAGPLLTKEPHLRPTGKAVAVKTGDKYDSQVLSNARVARNPDGSLAAVAFGVQTRTQGRGVSVRSKDVLVTYDAGRPTHIFSSAVPDWGGWTERALVTLQTDASGRVTSASEHRARSEQNWLPDAEAPVTVGHAERVVWNPR